MRRTAAGGCNHEPLSTVFGAYLHHVTYALRSHALDGVQKDGALMRCDQCEMLMINGVPCHETGCPNSRKTWIAERGEWVLFVECRECGAEVEAGESCSCQTGEGAIAKC